MQTHLHKMPRVSHFSLTLILLILIEPCAIKAAGRVLDSDTMKEMMIKRCGNPNTIHHHTTSLSNKFKSASSGTHLTYAFHSSVTNTVVNLDELRPVIKRAFQRWAYVLPFTFEEAMEGEKADIEIGFHSLEHGDSQPFDGPAGNIVAHVFASADGSISMLHYNADENWSAANPSAEQVDLESVAVHEIGHLLGLGHSTDKNAVMFAEIPAGTIKREPNQDDINGVLALYS